MPQLSNFLLMMLLLSKQKEGIAQLTVIVRGVRVDEDYPDPFGGYEERVYDDDGVLRETRRAEEDFQTYSAEEAERYGVSSKHQAVEMM